MEKPHDQTRRTKRYRYNAEGQLTKVTTMRLCGFIRDREAVKQTLFDEENFAYDLLGCRITKTDGGNPYPLYLGRYSPDLGSTQ